MALVKGQVQQINVGAAAELDNKEFALTKVGQLFTADWRYKLAAAGLVYSAHIGTLSAGADVGLIVGGGNGTTVDSDQPEMILGVDNGFLIPISLRVMCDMDADADGEYGEIIFFADRTQAPPTSATGTPGTVTPNNLLDGAGAFSGRCFGGVTTDLTDPVMSEFIDGEYVNVAEFVSNGTATNLTNGVGQRLKLVYEPLMPKLLAGPCSLVVCFGGTAAVNGMIAIEFAHVPAGWFPTS